MTLAVAAATAAALPAAADAAKASYRVTGASGTQKVTFRADSSTCLRFDTCGYRGTITYKFGGSPRGSLVLRSDRRGRLSGAADFTSSGTTSSKVTAGIDCRDRIRHRREHFTMRTRSRLGKLIFGLHGAKTDYLETDCKGPTEADLERDGALPTGRFKQKDFHGQVTSFNLRGSQTFRERGYSGSTSWKLKYKVRRSG
jgi:hypothetical protein